MLSDKKYPSLEKTLIKIEEEQEEIIEENTNILAIIDSKKPFKGITKLDYSIAVIYNSFRERLVSIIKGKYL